MSDETINEAQETMASCEEHNWVERSRSADPDEPPGNERHWDQCLSCNATEVRVRCGSCHARSPFEAMLPNYSSTQNALRCPACGSTRNNYNRAWGRLLRAAIDGGPVATHEATMELISPRC